MTKEFFYVLESYGNPGLYYIDSQELFTEDILKAERYSSPDEALKYWDNASSWRVCLVTINVTNA